VSGHRIGGTRLTAGGSPPAPLAPTEFREVMSHVPTGVTIVTTRDPAGTPHGFTAGTFCSVSLQPPLVSVCLATTARCFPVFDTCHLFVVNVLHRQHIGLARRFAERGADKFGPGGFHDTEAGLPAVSDALAVLECRVYRRYPAGDHLIVVGEVYRSSAGVGTPLVFVRRRFAELPDAGENRPT
jgi:flavin reductase ActVB